MKTPFKDPVGAEPYEFAQKTMRSNRSLMLHHILLNFASFLPNVTSLKPNIVLQTNHLLHY